MHIIKRKMELKAFELRNSGIKLDIPVLTSFRYHLRTSAEKASSVGASPLRAAGLSPNHPTNVDSALHMGAVGTTATTEIA